MTSLVEFGRAHQARLLRERRDAITKPSISNLPHHVQRRRWFLWTPLMIVGVILLTLEVTTWNPVPLLVALGLLLCLPWLVDGALERED